MTVKPRADGRYDVNDCLTAYDEWEARRFVTDEKETSDTEATDLLRCLVEAVRYGTP